MLVLTHLPLNHSTKLIRVLKNKLTLLRKYFLKVVLSIGKQALTEE